MAAGPGDRPAAAAEAPPERPATANPIITDTAIPVAPGQLSLQPYWSLDCIAGNFTGNWRRVGAGGNFYSMMLPVKITYGLRQNLEIYGQFPFIYNWADRVQNGGPSGNRSADFSGVGDLAVTLKYQFLEETAWRPAMSGIFTTVFPTGHHFRTNPGRLGTDILGSGVFSCTGGVNLSKWLGPVCLYSNLWYSVATGEPGANANLIAGPLMAPVHGRDLVIGNLAAELPLSGPWVALLEFYSSWAVGPLCRRPQEPVSILMGVIPALECVINSRWSCELGVAIEVAGKNAHYGYTPIFTVTLTY